MAGAPDGDFSDNAADLLGFEVDGQGVDKGKPVALAAEILIEPPAGIDGIFGA